MALIQKTVFISYRRKDISWALAVYQDLTYHGYDVFFDYTSIPSGDFEQNIISNIRARAHFVLILTPTTFDRCSEPGDWLRREVEVAIDEKRNITPLFFDGFNFGNDNVSQKLTGKLKNISRYNGMNVHQDYFTEAMERLRTKFLNTPLDAILYPVSTEVQEVVAEEKRAANMAAKEAKQVAERNARRKRQKEVVGKIISLISSNSRWLGIGGLILICLIFGGFGLNYLTNHLPLATATIPSTNDTPTFELATLTRVTFTPTPQPTETPIPIPTLGIGSTITSEKDGMVLVYVPAGKFIMGSGDGAADEKPIHTVNLDAFWIDQTEVTNAIYAKCVSKGVCKEPVDKSSSTHSSYYGNPEFDNYPVIYVDWNMANAYCSWADRKLPTEAEWEKAARGTDGRTYPWGEGIDCNKANYTRSCVGDTSPVKSYPNGVSPYGAYHMAGNVWEWVNDWYNSAYYASSPESNPRGPNLLNGTGRVLRGGSWNDFFNFARSAIRFRNVPSNSDFSVGFRCSRSP